MNLFARPTAEELAERESALPHQSYYALLGIPQTAESSEIQRAFHAFSERYHPDLFRDQEPEVQEQARTIFRRGAEAYGTLRSRAQRAAYDLKLARGYLRAGPEPEPSAPEGRQSLEDLCRSKAARLHARQAERAINEGRLGDAARLAERALLDDQPNPELEERIRAIQELLSLSGED